MNPRPDKPSVPEIGTLREDGFRLSGWQYRQSANKWYPLWLSPAAIANKNDARRQRYQNNKDYELSRNKRWLQRNKDRAEEYKQRWLEENKDHVKVRSKEYNQRNKEHLLETAYAWRAANPEKVRASDKRYRGNNPHKICAKAARRRALELATSAANTPEQNALIRVIYEAAARVKRCTGLAVEVDHIRPLSRGGGHVPSNLQILPDRINSRKGDRLDYHFENHSLALAA